MEQQTSSVFLDRDGTIIEEVGYLARIEQVHLLPGTVEALRLLNDNGLPALVVTNQSGVARGYFSEKTVVEVHEHLQELLKQQGVHIDGFYYCPHHPEHGDQTYRQACSCRKPQTGMIRQAAQDFSCDLGRSYLIGDTASDMEAAQRAGLKSILVLTGYGNETPAAETIDPTHTASDILAAVRWVIEDLGKS